MDAILCRLNQCAREAAPGSESFTNYWDTTLGRQFVSCWGDWFGGARDMDILSLDIYSQLRGQGYYWTSCRLDSVESAAAAQGKHAWIMEMRSAFRLPEILNSAGIHPLVRAHARRNALACQALMEQGTSHPLPALSLLNISTNGGPLENGCVEIDAAAFLDLARCVYADRHIETELPIRKKGGVYRISVPMTGDIAAALMFVYPQK